MSTDRYEDLLRTRRERRDECAQKVRNYEVAIKMVEGVLQEERPEPTRCDITQNPFFAMTRADAAHAVLSKRLQPLQTRVLVRLLKEQGFTFTAKDEGDSIRTAMARDRRKRFVRATPGGPWSLSDWLRDPPDGLTQDERESLRKRALSLAGEPESET